MEKEKYEPSQEEIEKAEEMAVEGEMTPEQEKMSEEREFAVNFGEATERKRQLNFRWLDQVNKSKDGGIRFFPGQALHIKVNGKYGDYTRIEDLNEKEITVSDEKHEKISIPLERIEQMWY